jgi:hypothetical protein
MTSWLGFLAGYSRWVSELALLLVWLASWGCWLRGSWLAGFQAGLLGLLAGWLAGWLSGLDGFARWLALLSGSLAGWLNIWLFALAGKLGLLSGWLVGWLAGLAGWLLMIDDWLGLPAGNLELLYVLLSV